jgi:hypothetical protein
MELNMLICEIVLATSDLWVAAGGALAFSRA